MVRTGTGKQGRLYRYTLVPGSVERFCRLGGSRLPFLRLSWTPWSLRAWPISF